MKTINGKFPKDNYEDLIKLQKETKMNAQSYAVSLHQSTGHLYGTKPYEFHLKMVVDTAKQFIHAIPAEAKEDVLAACWCHDVIEDCRQTYNVVKKNTNIRVAEIVFALTNEKGKNRTERSNDKYYTGIRDTQFAVFVKLCDRIANAQHSINEKSWMADLYRKENNHFIGQLGDQAYELYAELTAHLNEILAANSVLKPKLD